MVPYNYLPRNVALGKKKLYSLCMMHVVYINQILRSFTCALLLLFLLAPFAFSQEEEQDAQAPVMVRTVPEALRRPLRGEIPHYPQDFVIGELGRGNASEEAYRFALNLISSLQAGNTQAAIFTGVSQVMLSSLTEEISEIQPLAIRVGGGRTQIDGSISFLVRFIGREESITGELFLFPSPADDVQSYRFDDLLLEPRQSLADIRGETPFVFSPHQRFF
jgi:hypothetical protein